MLKQKKGQGLSITTIIIVIISLIVLVVIIAIFTGKMGNFSKGAEDAASCANTCKALNKGGGTPATAPTTTGGSYTCATGKGEPFGLCCCT